MENERITKKSRQLRLYFAKTAKDMILQSGIEEVTIRNIAKQAGYAYATIYNHFSSQDELLWLARSLIIEDIGDYIEKHSPEKPKSHSDVYEMFSAYADYFIDNPHAYSFLYFHSLNKGAKNTQSMIETDAYQEKFNKTFEYLLTTKEKQKVEQAVKLILYSIHGLLTLYISQNDDFGIENVHEELKKMIDYLLN